MEAITILSRNRKAVRIKEISEFLGVSKPSANAAMKSLADKGLVIHEKYGHIYLTEKGMRLGNSIYAKHEMLLSFLVDILCVPKEIAIKDACKLEHGMSNITMENFSIFVSFIKNSDIDSRSIIDLFKSYKGIDTDK